MAICAKSIFSVFSPFNWRLKSLARLHIPLSLALIYSSPELLICLFLVNLALSIALYYLRFKFFSEANGRPTLFLFRGEERYKPFVSVHVPLKDFGEKEALASLRALSVLNHDRMEVIVLHDLKEGSLSKNIKRFCRSRRQLFKLRSFSSKTSDLAEQLNECWRHQGKSTQWVMSILPGFCPSPLCLRRALKDLAARKASFAQLSKSVPLRGGAGASDVDFYETLELKGKIAPMKLLQTPNALLKANSLEKIGGWAPGPCTMAGTSLKLVGKGLKGISCSDCDGSLEQKHGVFTRRNVQALLELTPRQLRLMGKNRAMAVVLQLSASMEFYLLPALYLTLLALGDYLDINLAPQAPGAKILAFSTIIISLYLKLSLLEQKLGRVLKAKEVFSAYLAHLARNFSLNLFFIKDLFFPLPKATTRSCLEKPVLNFVLIGAGLLGSLLVTKTLYAREGNIAVLSPLLGMLLVSLGGFLILMDFLKEKALDAKR